MFLSVLPPFLITHSVTTAGVDITSLFLLLSKPLPASEEMATRLTV
jgi:hypothetical protein